MEHGDEVRHVKAMHGDEVRLVCGVDGCEKDYASKNALQMHKKEKHGVVSPSANIAWDETTAAFSHFPMMNSANSAFFSAVIYVMTSNSTA